MATAVSKEEPGTPPLATVRGQGLHQETAYSSQDEPPQPTSGDKKITSTAHKPGNYRLAVFVGGAGIELGRESDSHGADEKRPAV